MARFQYPSLTQPIVAGGETITEDKWHQPWSEPVRQKIAPRLAVALIASGLSLVEAPPFAETVTEDRWHHPFSEPIRLKPGLPAGQQQFLALHPRPVIAIGWYAPLAEPVRVKPGLRAERQQTVAWQAAPSPFVATGWHNWFSEPVRIKPALPVPEQHVFEFEPAPIISIAWHLPLAEPVRVKPGLLAALQPYEVSYHPQPFPFVPGSGGWYLPAPGHFVSGVTPGKPAVARRAKAGAPRQVAPKAEPPSFADVIGAQQPAKLADVLGSVFAAHFAQLTPPALDLYVPPASAVPATAGKPTPIPRAVIDAAADHVDAMDAAEALHALDQLERREHEAVIAILLHHFADGTNDGA